MSDPRVQAILARRMSQLSRSSEIELLHKAERLIATKKRQHPSRFGAKPMVSIETFGTVRAIQKALTLLGFAPGPVDGIQGAKTLAAIKRFQTAKGLVADGIPGPKTKLALVTAYKEASLDSSFGADPPPVNSATAALQSGKASLLQAIRELGMVVSEPAMYMLLGQAYTESGLGMMGGAFAQFQGTDNWGAVYWPSETKPPNPYSTGIKGGVDTLPGGQGFKSKIAVYPNQVAGAKGFLTTFRYYGKDVTSVFESPSVTATDISRAIYRHGYFGGCHIGMDSRDTARVTKLKAALAENPDATISCVGTRKIATILRPTQAEANELNIAEYATMIKSGALLARKANDAPPVAPPTTPTPTPSGGTSSGSGGIMGALGFLFKLALGIGIGYGGIRLLHRGQQ